MASEDKQRGVVFQREELERRRVLEGVQGVFLGEADGEGALERVEVLERQLGDFAALAAAQEENCFWVLDGLGLALGDCAGGAGIARFAGGFVLISLAELGGDAGNLLTFAATFWMCILMMRRLCCGSHIRQGTITELFSFTQNGVI